MLRVYFTTLWKQVTFDIKYKHCESTAFWNVLSNYFSFIFSPVFLSLPFLLPLPPAFPKWILKMLVGIFHPVKIWRRNSWWLQLDCFITGFCSILCWPVIYGPLPRSILLQWKGSSLQSQDILKCKWARIEEGGVKGWEKWSWNIFLAF